MANINGGSRVAERALDIAVVSAIEAPFVREDIELLSRTHRVRAQVGHGWGAAWRVFWLTLRSDVVLCWFASVYSAVAVAAARLISVRSLVVIGGVDVACEPQLKYGIWQSRWKSKLVRYALRRASLVLAVDPSLREDAMRLAQYDGRNILYLPTGYDPEFWKPLGIKVPLVLTVAAVDDEVRFRVKGLDTLIEAARRLSEVRFVLIGVSQPLVARYAIPENMTVHPRIDRKALLPYYQHAKVYCQPSRREGLANTLCEAMLCGCIPVATEVGGNPTAVGQTGFLIPPDRVEALVEAIVRALAADERVGIEARTRVVSLFPREKRDRELLRLVAG